MAPIIHNSLWKDPVLSTDGIFQTYLPKNLARPEANAFVDASTGRAYTRSDLRARALRLGLGLKQAVPRSKVEYRKGKRLAVIFSPNNVDYPLVFFGCQAAMTVVSAANAGYTDREFVHQLVDGQPDFLFVHPDVWPVAKKALSGLAQDPKHSGWVKNLKTYFLVPRQLLKGSQDGIKSFEDLYVPENQVGSYNGDDLGPEGMDETAILCYSSGTTGMPKGVETTHRNLTVTAARSSVFGDEITGTESVIGVLPFFHIYGMVQLVAFPVYRQMTVYTVPKFEPILFLETIQKYKVTNLFLVPPILVFLANAPVVDNYDLSSIEAISSGAAPLGEKLQSKTIERLRKGGKKGPGNPELALTQGYGMTETTAPCMTTPSEWADRKVGAAGQLYPGNQAMLVDIDNNPVELVINPETGRTPPGELCLRGSGVMKGYWQNEKATRETFLPNGFFKTGDIAEIDKDGFFFIVDRLKELIKYKGFQVAPADLEAFLVTHPKVSDVGVIGVMDEAQATELPRAYVVPAAGLDGVKDKKALADELTQFIADNMANHKRLRGGVFFMEAIPKSAAGKILRKELRAMAKVDDQNKSNALNSTQQKLSHL